MAKVWTWKMLQKGLGDTETFEFVNLNPKGNRTSDCSTRALAAALKLTYNDVLELQCAYAKKLAHGLSSPEVTEAILLARGFRRHRIVVERGKKRLCARDVAKLTKGCAVRAFIQIANHDTCAYGGRIRDIWDCGDKCVYRLYTDGELPDGKRKPNVKYAEDFSKVGKREWKAMGNFAVLCIDGVPQGYEEDCGNHAAAVEIAQRLNEEDAEGEAV